MTRTMNRATNATLATLVCTLGLAVGASAPAEAAASSWCKDMRHQLAYSYTYQGARVTVPSGKALHRELRREGLKGSELSAACRALVLEYRSH